MNDNHPSVLGEHVKNLEQQATHLAFLPQSSRPHHFYTLGRSGSGKSTLFLNLMMQDIKAGRSLALIDPHGDLSQTILNHLPPERHNDLIYFSPDDYHYPVAFNPLANITRRTIDPTADGIVSMFKHVYHDSWGPRLENSFKNILKALMEVKGTSLLDVLTFIYNPNFANHILTHVKDPLRLIR